MSDLIIGVAKLREMHGTCTLLETSGYVVDAKSHTILLPVRILKQAKMKPYFSNITFIFTYFLIILPTCLFVVYLLLVAHLSQEVQFGPRQTLDPSICAHERFYYS